MRFTGGWWMKVIAFNGSPRKKWNTATLLEKALEGASSQGAETELIHLYDLNYKGCISCFSCKMKNGRSYGKCAVKDDLTPIFQKVLDTQALIFGSPIYLGTATGQMRSFMERLVFPFLPYSAGIHLSEKDQDRFHLHLGCY
jgi:multimeric flavodoxin WrbA